MDSPMEWSLVITTWAGLDPGAQHYYGRIEGNDWPYPVTKHRIKREIVDVADALALYSNYPGDCDGCERYVGMKTDRFNSEAELVEATIEFWRSEDLGGTLFLGSPVYDEDRKVLASVE